MKKINLFKRLMLLVSALLVVGGSFATNNFNAWDMSVARTGTSQGIACGNLNFTGKDITIELWLNIPSSNFVNGVTIASTRHNGNNGFSIDVTSDNRLRAFFRNDDGDKLDGRTDFVFPFFFNKEDIVDKWVHIAIVFSSTDNIARSYLNGEVYQDIVKSENPYTPYEIGWIGNIKPDGNNVGGLRLGYWYNESGNFYGKIADFRIWSVGRTDEEIKANYNKNLTGTYENNPGLYINYRFYTYERGFINDAYPDVAANKGWCNPEGNWNTYYKRETLSTLPQALTIANEALSWTTSAGEWEVTIFKKEDDTKVYADTIATNSITLNTLAELAEGANYYAQVRTLNNNVWSGLATSADFTVDKNGTGLNETTQDEVFSVINGSLLIKTEKPHTLNIYTVAGQLVRSIRLVAGENTINGLAEGFYIANNKKIAIR